MPEPMTQTKAQMKIGKIIQPIDPHTPRDLSTYAECGDAVEWFPSADKGEPPQCAIVTKVMLNGVVVANVMSPDWGDTRPMDACHHVDDPKARLDANQDGGGWRHKPLTIAVRRLLIAQAFLWWENGKLVPKPVHVPEPKPIAPPA